MQLTQDARQLDTAPLSEDVSSPKAKLVYLYLNAAGSGTVEELADALDLKRLDLYSILDTLSDSGLVTEDRDRYVTTAA